MHGAVNQAIEDLVNKEFGAKAWKTIKTKAGFKDDMFLSNKSYPDEMTFKLVVAAHETTGLSVDELLFSFGEHWILETGINKYGAVLQAGGRTYEEFMKNLPEFHGRVMILYPKIIPPEFGIEFTKKSFIVDYQSSRSGLTSFVKGLLSGIAKMFDKKVEIEIIKRKDQGAENDRFKIIYE